MFPAASRTAAGLVNPISILWLLGQAGLQAGVGAIDPGITSIVIERAEQDIEAIFSKIPGQDYRVLGSFVIGLTNTFNGLEWGLGIKVVDVEIEHPCAVCRDRFRRRGNCKHRTRQNGSDHQPVSRQKCHLTLLHNPLRKTCTLNYIQRLNLAGIRLLAPQDSADAFREFDERRQALKMFWVSQTHFSRKLSDLKVTKP